MADMIVRPTKILKFDFTPTLAYDTSCAPYLFEDAQTGDIAVLDAALNVVSAFSLGFPTGGSCSVNPVRGCFSAVGKGAFLRVADFRGNEKHRLCGDYVCAAYNGDELWALARIGHKQLAWRVFGADLAPVAELAVDDPLYDSDIRLTKIPNCSDMVVELAAGQDGSALYLLSRNARALSATEMFPGECFSAPVFNRVGTRFLTLDFYERILYHYSFPALQKLGEFPLDGRLGREDGEPGEYGDFLYIDGKTAVVNRDNRCFRLDLTGMALTGEIIVAGHEPKPTEHFYPRLAGDRSLMTDIRFMTAAGDRVFCQLDFEGKNTALVLAGSDLTAGTERGGAPREKKFSYYNNH
jgi:hypothetical protein